MVSIIDIYGQQYKVHKGDKIFVSHIKKDIGSKVEMDSLLLCADDKDILMSKEDISKKKVIAEILEHKKGDTVIAFKMKRRKGFRKKKGHRTLYTKIFIKDIV